MAAVSSPSQYLIGGLGPAQAASSYSTMASKSVSCSSPSSSPQHSPSRSVDDPAAPRDSGPHFFTKNSQRNFSRQRTHQNAPHSPSSSIPLTDAMEYLKHKFAFELQRGLLALFRTERHVILEKMDAAVFWNDRFEVPSSNAAQTTQTPTPTSTYADTNNDIPASDDSHSRRLSSIANISQDSTPSVTDTPLLQMTGTPLNVEGDDASPSPDQSSSPRIKPKSLVVSSTSPAPTTSASVVTFTPVISSASALTSITAPPAFAPQVSSTSPSHAFPLPSSSTKRTTSPLMPILAAKTMSSEELSLDSGGDVFSQDSARKLSSEGDNQVNSENRDSVIDASLPCDNTEGLLSHKSRHNDEPESNQKMTIDVVRINVDSNPEATKTKYVINSCINTSEEPVKPRMYELITADSPRSSDEDRHYMGEDETDVGNECDAEPLIPFLRNRSVKEVVGLKTVDLANAGHGGAASGGGLLNESRGNNVFDTSEPEGVYYGVYSNDDTLKNDSDDLADCYFKVLSRNRRLKERLATFRFVRRQSAKLLKRAIYGLSQRSTSPKSFTCLLCGAQFKTKRLLCKHRFILHSIKRQLVCGFCRGRFDKSALLHTHFQTCHRQLFRPKCGLGCSPRSKRDKVVGSGEKSGLVGELGDSTGIGYAYGHHLRQGNTDDALGLGIQQEADSRVLENHSLNSEKDFEGELFERDNFEERSGASEAGDSHILNGQEESLHPDVTIVDPEQDFFLSFLQLQPNDSAAGSKAPPRKGRWSRRVRESQNTTEVKTEAESEDTPVNSVPISGSVPHSASQSDDCPHDQSFLAAFEPFVKLTRLRSSEISRSSSSAAPSAAVPPMASTSQDDQMICDHLGNSTKSCPPRGSDLVLSRFHRSSLSSISKCQHVGDIFPLSRERHTIKNGSEGRTRYRCHICQQLFSDKVRLVSHVSLRHSEESPIHFCFVCDGFYPRRAS